MNPSVLSVFQRQSNGFEYNAPLVRPSGPVIVGSAVGEEEDWLVRRFVSSGGKDLRLYTRVRAWRNERVVSQRR
jgi:hypothetical protein